jgi:hypothetical protein
MRYDVTEFKLTVALPIGYSLTSIKDKLYQFEYNGRNCCMGRIMEIYEDEVDTTSLEGFSDVRKYDLQLFVSAKVELLDNKFKPTIQNVLLCTELMWAETTFAITDTYVLYHEGVGLQDKIKSVVSAIAESIKQYYKEKCNEE